MANTDKRYQKSTTPILDDEDNHSSHHLVQALWLQRQPDWQEGVTWEDCDEDVQGRYYDERREQCQIRTTAKWDALSEDSRRMQIESYNNTVDALDKMMHVMYGLQHPIPESIRKIACKEFEW